MKLRRPRPDQDDEMEHKDVDFLWKQGPSPPPLKGRPSLGLIRTGQVRIMSKQLARAGRGNHAKTCAEVRFRWMGRRAVGRDTLQGRRRCLYMTHSFADA